MNKETLKILSLIISFILVVSIVSTFLSLIWNFFLVPIIPSLSPINFFVFFGIMGSLLVYQMIKQIEKVKEMLSKTFPDDEF
jgi:hypothetical protein